MTQIVHGIRIGIYIAFFVALGIIALKPLFQSVKSKRPAWIVGRYSEMSLASQGISPLVKKFWPPDMVPHPHPPQPPPKDDNMA